MSYCTVEDLRAEGVTEEQYTDEQLEKLIEASCSYIDMITGQFFEPREKVMTLDGRGGRILVLPVFLSLVNYVKVDGEIIDDYVLYNRMEDRAYPKIYRLTKWPLGRLNVEVSGVFGYVEEDGTPPSAIKRAAMKLALYNFPALSDKDAQEEKNLRVLLVSETTDGHSYSLSGDAIANSLTGDTEIDQILKRYMRSKIRMALA